MYNAAAAALAAGRAGVSLKSCAAALKGMRFKGFMRFEQRRALRGRLILDCYNANPDSMNAAIESLRAVRGKITAVIGDMLELGAKSRVLHYGAGRALASAGIKEIIFTGRYAQYAKAGFMKGAGRAAGARVIKNRARAAKEIKAALKKGRVVFIKGSRANRLEELVKNI